MECGINIPQVYPDAPVDLVALHAFLRGAEQLGCHSLWVLEQPMGTTPSLEPLSLLAHAAAVTETIRLGTAVLLLPLRTPVGLAKVLASVDHLSGGRLIVGLALGGRPEDYPAFGLSPARRDRRFVEAVGLLERLWTQPSVTFSGEFWQLQDVAVEPKPVQLPRPPLWFGGGSPRALQRLAQLGDGFIGAGSATTAQFREQVQLVRTSVAQGGRDVRRFSVSKRVYVAVDEDRPRAQRRLQEWFGLFYKDPAIADRAAVFGGIEACVDGLADVADAGADLIILHPVFDELAQLETLWREVVPRVRAMVRS